MGLNVTSRRAFTLIELSIVLVIIGLLIGDILVGRDLIQSALARATISQIEKYDAAVNTFRNKYKCLPGDCEKATEFGFAEDCTNLSRGCNDGVIEGNFLFLPLYQEALDFWGQLSEAKLVDGNYRGYTAYQDPITVGIDIPSVKINPQAMVWVSGAVSGAYAGAPNYYWLGLADPVNTAYQGVLIPIQNYLIDAKMDDGLPRTGRVIIGGGL